MALGGATPEEPLGDTDSDLRAPRQRQDSEAPRGASIGGMPKAT